MRQETPLIAFPMLGNRWLSRVIEYRMKFYFEIREWVDNDKYTGFTKRGIKLSCVEELEELRAFINVVLERGYLPSRKACNYEPPVSGWSKY